MYLKGIFIKFGPFIVSFILFESLFCYIKSATNIDLIGAYIETFKWWLIISLAVIAIIGLAQGIFKVVNKIKKKGMGN